MGEGKSRTTVREHLEAAARQGDPEAIAELEAAPPLPPLAAHIWLTFLDLHATRPSTGMGVSRLSRLDVQAWERDEGQALEPWERRALMAIDAAWLKTVLDNDTKREAAR